MSKSLNIMQIDLEDWFCDLDISEWDVYDDRAVQSSEKILDLLKETNNTATFFILGYVAERHPDLVKKIADQGHEIGSHGYNHQVLTKFTPDEFEADLLKSKIILEDIIKDKIWGYRAPLFTLVKKTSWAVDIIKKLGFKYDSSVFPVKTPLYGVPDAPRFPYLISSHDLTREDHDSELLEFPLSVFQIPVLKKNIPIAGGFYLRFFPYWFIAYCFKKINRMDKPAICYIHPWELDPDQPKIKPLAWYHYFKLKSSEAKYKKLLKKFNFVSTREWINQQKAT